MGRDYTILADELDFGNVDNEADAIDAWGAAWSEYWLSSSVAGINPPNAAAYVVATTAFKTALLGMSAVSTPAVAAARFIAAQEAFWWALVPSTCWVKVPPLLGVLTTPPSWMVLPAQKVAWVAVLALIFTININETDPVVARTRLAKAFDNYNGNAAGWPLETPPLVSVTPATVTDTTAPTPLIFPVL